MTWSKINEDTGHNVLKKVVESESNAIKLGQSRFNCSKDIINLEVDGWKSSNRSFEVVGFCLKVTPGESKVSPQLFNKQESNNNDCKFNGSRL